MGVFLMKSKLILFIPLLFVIIFLGCEQSEEAGKSANQADLKSFIDSVELPYNLSIDFDPAEVKTVDSAKIYSAVYLDFDHDVVIDTLLEGEVTATENYAEGIQYQAESGNQTEYLTIYDGGESLDMESGVNGGLNYGIVENNQSFFNKISLIIENYPGPPESTAQNESYNLKSDFESYADLDFMPFDEAWSEVEQTLTDVGFPSFEIAETYSLDLDMMLEHYQLYLEDNLRWGIDIDDYDWSKADENYLFFLRQTVDGLPLMNLHWLEVPTNITEAFSATSMLVIYTKDGIIDVSANNFVDVKESISEEPLLSGVDALTKVIDHYSDTILANQTRMTNLELSYVAIYRGGAEYELTPVWMVEIAQENEWTDQLTEEPYWTDDYTYYLVNAVTGERITEASDLN